MGLIQKSMDAIFTGGAGGTVGKIADLVGKFVIDKDGKRIAKDNLNLKLLEAELKTMMVEADLEKELRVSLKEENLGQMRINEIDAKGDRIQRWWRPACGWMGVLALGYSSFGYSMVSWGNYWFGGGDILPTEPNTQFIQIILVGMLGLRGTESYFKRKENTERLGIIQAPPRD